MLLGLDLASRLTGWCCGDGTKVPECGAWRFPPIEGDYGLLLSTLDDYLNALSSRWTITEVAYEAPLLIPRRQGPHSRGFGDTLGKLRLLYPMGAYVEFWCRRRAIPCFEVTVADIKKEVTGFRHADKEDLIEVAQKCGLVLPSKSNGADDAADAWGVWLLLLRAENKELSARWDKRIWGPRGALL